jgi:hypothetical protein
MEDKFNSDLSIKELTVNHEIQFKRDIKKVQDKLISFCMNTNLFQTHKTMYELNLQEQFKFNECVDFVVNRIQNDISDLEGFYSSCKATCTKDNPDILENIDEFITKHSWVFQPDLHPCLADCTDLFKSMYKKYIRYMTKGSDLINI